MPTPSSTSGVAVNDLEQWGLLIKSWATSLNYVDSKLKDQPSSLASIAGKSFELPPTSTVPVPSFGGGTVSLPRAVAMDVNEFTERVANTTKVTITMPPSINNVIVVQGDANTLVVRLPPKQMLQSSETQLLATGSGIGYPIPDFYDKLYHGARKASYPGGHDDIMELHAYRIGEYTLNNCA